MTTNESSVLLTHWDADIYVPQVAAPWLQELVLYTLLFGQVLVRDVDVFQSKAIARHLATSQTDFDIFVELVRNGCVRIITLPPKSYEDIQADPRISPFTARSERHTRSRSFMGNQWHPDNWQELLCLKLDAALSGTRLRYMAPFPSENDFASHLARVLTSPRIKNVPWLSDISENARKVFIELCADDLQWEAFLVDSGETSIVGAGQGFYRTAAYQCARKFPESERAIRNLIQSVYARRECSREETEGRYGGRLLWEVPDLEEEPNEEGGGERDSSVRVELVQKRARLDLPVRPGIGAVIAATREGDAFKAFQQSWAAIGRPEIPEQPVWAAYAALTEDFSINASKEFVASGNHKVWTVAAAGLTMAGHWHGLSFGLVPIEASLALLGPRLSRFVRSIGFARKVQSELMKAVDIRTNKID